MSQTIDFSPLWWLIEVEAAMAVHRRVYPDDGPWRRWIRANGTGLTSERFERMVRMAKAILDGRADHFVEAEESK